MLSQKNSLIPLIEQRGFDPQEFTWEICTSNFAGTIETLVHKSTGFYYKFDINEDWEDLNHFAIFSPGNDTFENRSGPENSWIIHRDYFQRWLNNLRREVDSSDLWSLIAQDKTMYEIAPAIPKFNSEPFSQEEQVSIVAQLNEISSYLISLPHTNPEHEERVEEAIEYLVDQTKHQGRRDWVFLSYGVLINLCMALALAPDNYKAIGDFIKHMFSYLVNFKLPTP